MELLKPKWQSNDTTIKVHVHSITVGVSVEDPEIYIAEPIIDWQKSEVGKWVMEKSDPSPTYHRIFTNDIFGYTYYIFAYLLPKDYTYFELKFK